VLRIYLPDGASNFPFHFAAGSASFAQQEVKVQHPRGDDHYDLEDRTFRFASDVRALVKRIRSSVGNLEDGKQLVRASGSVGANYIEANEALSRKDLTMRVRICRKEAKESRYFLRLLDLGDRQELEAERQRLADEARQLMCIFGAILRKVE
jgi:four helix bundle protein